MKNEGNKIFGFTLEEIHRQTKKPYDVDPEACIDPLSDFEAIEPAIEGGKKIINDPRLKDFLHDIYVGKE